MTTHNVILVEDDPDISEVIAFNLRREHIAVDCFADGTSGQRALDRGPVDLAILDLMLPGRGGLEICRWIRAHPRLHDLPVLIVTAKSDETDLVVGFGMGADDYLAKPFRPRELVARAKALLRRTRSRAAGADTVVHGPLTIDRTAHIAYCEGEPLDLTATEYRILLHMCCHPGATVSREGILRAAHGEQALAEPRTIDVHILAIRRKLGAHAGLLETVRGHGYRLAREPTAP